MNRQQITETLAKPYAQQLLHGRAPARLAYTAPNGSPRVVPIGFWTEADKIVMATTPNAPKVTALQADPRVAITIDTADFPPKVLLVRGTVDLQVVDGVPTGYLTSGRKLMTEDQYPEWAAGVHELYDWMVVLTVTPVWVKLLDFESTIPEPVEELVRAKAAATYTGGIERRRVEKCRSRRSA